MLKQRTFAGDSKVTATVSVPPAGELSSDLAQSLRLAVAGAVADLSSNDVTVFNLATGKKKRSTCRRITIRSIHSSSTRSTSTARVINNASPTLAFIPNVLVSVNVELDNRLLRTLLRLVSSTRLHSNSKPRIRKLGIDVEETGSEPGVQSNQPRNLKQLGSSREQRTT